MSEPTLKAASFWRARRRHGDDDASADPLSHPGDHSFWASMVLVEGRYRPVAADELVVVVLDDRLLCRVPHTAFTLTIHFDDVVRMLCVQRVGRIELHVPSAESEVGAPAADALPTRMYVIEPLRADVCSELYRLLFPRLRRAAREVSMRFPKEDAVSVGTAWRVQLGQPSFFPPEALEITGFYEVPLGEGDGAVPGPDETTMVSVDGNTNDAPFSEPESAGAQDAAGWSPEAQKPSPNEVVSTDPVPLPVEHVRPVRIHYAVAPPEWRTEWLKHPLRYQQLEAHTQRREPPLPADEAIPSGHCARCHERLARVERLVDEALTDRHLLQLPGEASWLTTARPRGALAAGPDSTPFELACGPISHA